MYSSLHISQLPIWEGLLYQTEIWYQWSLYLCSHLDYFPFVPQKEKGFFWNSSDYYNKVSLLRIWPHIQNAQWDICLLKEHPNPNFHVWFWSQALVRLQLTKGHMEKCMTWELAIQTFTRSWTHRNAILQDLTVKVGAFWEWQPLQIKIKSVNKEHIPQQKQDLWKNPKSRSVQGFVQPYCQDLWL